MDTKETSDRALDERLDVLRSFAMTNPAEHVMTAAMQRMRWQKRQVIAAALGACISLVASIHFAMKSEVIGLLGAALATVALVVVANRSAHAAIELATLKPGKSMFAVWQERLDLEIRQTFVSEICATLFVALTIWVVSRYGILNPRSLMYLFMAAVICTFALYQRLVTRPSLRREQQSLIEDD